MLCAEPGSLKLEPDIVATALIPYGQYYISVLMQVEAVTKEEMHVEIEYAKP